MMEMAETVEMLIPIILQEVIGSAGTTKTAYVTSDKGVGIYTTQYVKHGGITVSAEPKIVIYCTSNCAENSSHMDIVTDTNVYIHIHSSDGVETQYLHQLGQLSGTIGTVMTTGIITRITTPMVKVVTQTKKT